MARVRMALKTPARIPVPTAGTPVPLSPVPLVVNNFSVQRDPDNTGAIYVGEQAEIIGGAAGIILDAATPAVGITADDSAADEDDIVYDLNQIYIDADNSGEGVYLTYTVQGSVHYNET